MTAMAGLPGIPSAQKTWRRLPHEIRDGNALRHTHEKQLYLVSAALPSTKRLIPPADAVCRLTRTQTVGEYHPVLVGGNKTVAVVGKTFDRHGQLQEPRAEWNWSQASLGLEEVKVKNSSLRSCNCQRRERCCNRHEVAQ